MGIVTDIMLVFHLHIGPLLRALRAGGKWGT